MVKAFTTSILGVLSIKEITMLKILFRKIYVILDQYRVNQLCNKKWLKASAKNCYKCGGDPIINPAWAYGFHKWMQKNFWIGCSKCYWATTSFNDLDTAIRNWNWHINYKDGDRWEE